MNRLIVIIVFACLFVGGYAQNTFCFGPKVGFSSNQLKINIDTLQTTNNGNFQFGAFLRFGKKTYIQPEVNYLMKSGKLETMSGVITNEEIKVRGIEVPVLIGRYLVLDDSFNLRVLAGPSGTFFTNKKVKISNLNSSWPIASEEDIRNTLWSLHFGLGMDVLFVTFDIRYQLGLSNIYNGSADTKLTSNCFNFSLGIKLF